MSRLIKAYNIIHMDHDNSAYRCGEIYDNALVSRAVIRCDSSDSVLYMCD